MLDIVASARDEYVLRGKCAGVGGDGDGVPVGRRSNLKGGDAALLRNLVRANMEEEADGDKGLTEDELLSNVFTFLLAGHETSANTLSFALVLIALHPEVQQKMYEESMRIWPEGSDTTSENFTSEYTLATFRETLRLFPVETRLPKVTTSDTKLTGRRFSKADLVSFTPDAISKGLKKFEIAIPKGSSILIDCYGVHRNPMYWGTDCRDFRPERFIDTETYRWPRDAFLGFSAGARGCIGARFALTEGICILALFVQRFEIIPPPEVVRMEKEGKGWEERFKWMTRWAPEITIRPVNARVGVRRRV
ncbi:cytochrome P450 [Stereum hirsutum FP-91666 SS1]|uniref:cytochrome P450 n=1 Tax=Stereum hirsutum (strain FP-91666) TaxID=721885 RepID=UPI000440EEFB|nr:cytochrome P450 [Stereum hirsutum FP-91666 SS1]EIM88754.1 cytochrome P450 [Stereum hirsutum FP-91666 SS1]